MSGATIQRVYHSTTYHMYRYRELNPNPQIRSLMPYPLGYTGSSARGGNRTRDTQIKSLMPYHLATRALVYEISYADVFVSL